MSRRAARRMLDRIRSQPWAITPEGLNALMAMLEDSRGLSPEALAAFTGRPAEGTSSVTVRDGVATLPITGVLFRYDNFYCQYFGCTSYETVAQDFAQVLADPSIKAILVTLDSPGGEVNGCSALAEMLFQARGQKPIVAVVADQACSAAYWLASACDRIVAADTAIIGALGARMTFVDFSEYDAQWGIKIIDMVSAQTPAKKDDNPTTATGQAAIQTLLNDTAAVFLASVSRNRGVSAEVVLTEYGQGGVFVGQKAVAAGIADALGSVESVQAELAGVTAAPAAAAPGATGPTAAAAALLADTKIGAAGMRAAAFASGTKVTSQVGRMVSCAPGQVGTIVAIEEGVTAYAVDFGEGDERTGYRWLLENEIAPAEEADPAADPAEEGDGDAAAGDEGRAEGDPAPTAAAADPVPVAVAAAIVNAAPAGADPVSAPSVIPVADAAAVATAERTRVLGILALQRRGHEALIRTCLEDPACTPAQAALRMAEADQATLSRHLAAFRQDEAELQAPAAAAAAPLTGDRAVAARIIQTHESLTTPRR